MALTEERTRELGGQTSTDPARTEVSRRTMLELLVAWAVLFPLAISLEPLPASQQEPWWGVLASAGLLAALAATVTGLAQRRRWGIGASVVASSVFALGVFACPATGHHPMGFWWFGELAAAAILVTMSARAYLRRAA